MIKSRGFTLMELVIVMVIIGVLAAGVAVFITSPVMGYLDANRRAQLTDAADIALRRMSRDLRLALPNSIRVGGSNNPFLEYIPTSNGGRYREKSGNRLVFSSPVISFDYIGETLAGETGFVVVANNNVQPSSSTRPTTTCPTAGGADAYEGCNRARILSVTSSTVNISVHTFVIPSPANRFHIVPASGPVTLACENVGTNLGDGTGTLKIYTNYNTGDSDWGSTAPSAAPSPAGSLLAQYVSICSFVWNYKNGLVILDLELTRGNETVHLFNEVHVENVP